MKLLFTVTSLLLLTGVLGGGAADAASKAESPIPVKAVDKPNWEFTPNPAVPNVLILGDSISIGYTLPLRQLLQGKANVFRPMLPDGMKPENCSGTVQSLKQIDQWLAGRKWAVIHFNWGLHDLKHVVTPGSSQNSSRAEDPVQATVEEYSRNLEMLVGKLEATGARLIFATTTPVPPGSTNPLREVDAPIRYNAAALKIMKARQIPVNDLFGFCEPRLAKIQYPRNVHFNPEGCQALAKQVAAVIETSLAASVKQTRTP